MCMGGICRYIGGCMYMHMREHEGTMRMGVGGRHVCNRICMYVERGMYANEAAHE